MGMCVHVRTDQRLSFILGEPSTLCFDVGLPDWVRLAGWPVSPEEPCLHSLHRDIR